MEFEVIKNAGSGQSTVIAFFPEQKEPLVTATSDHPHFSSIVRGLQAGDESVYGLFNISEGINKKLRATDSIGSRYAVRNGIFYRDLDPMHNSLTDQIIRFMDEGVDDWHPLVKFLDKVDRNPSAESREALMKWIAADKLTLTPEGDIVGYKCVVETPEGYASTVSGPAVVDGQEINAFVPQSPGSVVEMSRSMVDSDNRNECSVGLHVGTFKYATWYKGNQSNRTIMEVHFDPADAVSVPNDHNFSKVRVCRYKVIGLKDSPYTGAVLPMEDFYTASQVTQYEDEYYDDVDAPDNW